MKILIDTNVVLDLLMDRQPFSEAAARVFDRVERGEVTACLCATTLTTIHYLCARELGDASTRSALQDLLDLCEVASVTRPVLEHALSSKLTDFEDAVLVEAGVQSGATAVVTRNVKDFRGAGLPAYAPIDWLALPLKL